MGPFKDRGQQERFIRLWKAHLLKHTRQVGCFPLNSLRYHIPLSSLQVNRLYSTPTTGTLRATLLFATLSRLSFLSGVVIHRLLRRLLQNLFLSPS